MKHRHFLLPVLLTLASPAAQAAGGAGADLPATGGAQIQVDLTLYAGGIGFGKMDLDTTLHSGEYRSVANFQTSGVVNAFWQTQIQASTSGKIGGKELQPALYNSFTTNSKGRKQEISLTYENADPRLYADPVYSVTGYEVKPEERKSTLDPLSALTFIVSGVGVDAGNPCSLTAPVFDGRRRYNIEMTKVKDTDVKMDNGLYAGKATLCQIKYKALAGMRQTVLKKNSNFPTINAWLVRYPSAIPGRSFAVPVRIWADTPYGQMSVVANSIKIDGQTPKGG